MTLSFLIRPIRLSHTHSQTFGVSWTGGSSALRTCTAPPCQTTTANPLLRNWNRIGPSMSPPQWTQKVSCCTFITAVVTKPRPLLWSTAVIGSSPCPSHKNSFTTAEAKREKGNVPVDVLLQTVLQVFWMKFSDIFTTFWTKQNVFQFQRNLLDLGIMGKTHWATMERPKSRCHVTIWTAASKTSLYCCLLIAVKNIQGCLRNQKLLRKSLWIYFTETFHSSGSEIPLGKLGDFQLEFSSFHTRGTAFYCEATCDEIPWNKRRAKWAAAPPLIWIHS